MSTACKCERCGEFYLPNKDDEAIVPNGSEIENFNKISLVNHDYANNSGWNTSFKYMDICPKCAHSFNHWWMNPRLEVSDH